MSTVELDLANKAKSWSVKEDQWVKSQKAYRCHVLLIKEEDASYSAVVLNLPGAGSCGTTEEEALHNVREAVQGAIESYLCAGEEIPWVDSFSVDIPPDAQHKWIVVHV